MLYVRIELWPQGRKDRARLLGEATIANDGSGGIGSSGAYDVRLLKSPEYAKKPGTWKRGRVDGFPRLRLGPWDLLLRGLAACLATRNPAAASAAVGNDLGGGCSLCSMDDAEATLATPEGHRCPECVAQPCACTPKAKAELRGRCSCHFAPCSHDPAADVPSSVLGSLVHPAAIWAKASNTTLVADMGSLRLGVRTTIADEGPDGFFRERALDRPTWTVSVGCAEPFARGDAVTWQEAKAAAEDAARRGPPAAPFAPVAAPTPPPRWSCSASGCPCGYMHGPGRLCVKCAHVNEAAK